MWEAEITPLSPDADNAAEGTAMPDHPHITINGQIRPCSEPKPLRDLLSELQLSAAHVAVAINDRIVPRAQHCETVVHPSDRIEIVHPVGGG